MVEVKPGSDSWSAKAHPSLRTLRALYTLMEAETIGTLALFEHVSFLGAASNHSRRARCREDYIQSFDRDFLPVRDRPTLKMAWIALEKVFTHVFTYVWLS